MIKVDLITGFLGSGKTTFLKKYARYLMGAGLNICILENDFGAVNVDMMLLQDLMGEHCELEMIAGGCDEDCHRRRFKTKLISMGMCGYDRVLVEPSGIFDVDEFFDLLHEEPLDRWYEIGSVITIADAGLEEHLSEESEYLLASQLAPAGTVLLSKCQDVSEETIVKTTSHLNSALEHFGCKRILSDEIIVKDWETLTDADFKAISNSGYKNESAAKLWFDSRKTFTSLYFLNVRLPETALRAVTEALMADTACGDIFRIKGFLLTDDGRWLELNATHEQITIRPIANGQEVIIVIGENLVDETIKKHLYPHFL